MADHDGGLSPTIARRAELERPPRISWAERYAVLLVCAYFGAVTALIWVMDNL
jgi:hypothetical protein